MTDAQRILQMLNVIMKRLVRVETRLAVLMVTTGAPIGRPTTTDQPTTGDTK